MAGTAADELVAHGIAAARAAAATADEPIAEDDPQAEAKVCAWCSATENLKRCGGCKKKLFCDNGKKCLKEAWTKGGHKQECKAAQRASAGDGPKALPAAMKTAPKWVQRPPASESTDFRGPQMSDSFDQLPLDEEDECAICMGDPMSRSGQGVVALECSHRFHRDCVAALRSRKVASPCTSCDSDPPPPAWDDALRRYVRVRLFGQLAGVAESFVF